MNLILYRYIAKLAMKLIRLFVVFYFSVLWLSGCSNEPILDKDTQIRNALKSMEAAIEKKQLDDFFDYVSDDFKSTERGWMKKDAERLLRIRLMRNSSVHVHQSVKHIKWHDNGDEKATLEVVAAMAGTAFSLSDMPSFRGDMVQFEVTFELIDSRYLVTHSEWRRASPSDFVF